MQRLGYVTRRHKPDNRKKIYIYLTPKGRQLKRKLVPMAEDVNRIAARSINAKDIAVTRRVLLMAIENLAREEAAKKKTKRRQTPPHPPDRG
jgi:DNA-binding MarR family transcriptional regulator